MTHADTPVYRRKSSEAFLLKWLLVKRKRLALLIGLVTLTSVLIYFFQKQALQVNIEYLKEVLRSFGVLGPVVVGLLIIISMVFSPLAAFPFWVASLALYGYGVTLVTTLVANNLGSVVNFWLARRYGRPLVIKFIGQKGIGKVDEIARVMGLEILALGRVLGGASGDYLSYAAGLTLMKFRPYLLITVLGTLPVISLNLWILHKALIINPAYLIVLAAIGYPLAIALPIIIYRKKIRAAK